MLKKLNLDQTKIYEQTIATYEIAKMLVSFIKGRKHYLSVGAEQGDVETWDDLVIEDKVDHHIHYQIKRQNTDFCTHNSIRDTVKRRDEKGTIEPRDLSTIDKSMKALADWINNSGNDISTKEFCIELPTSEVQFKNSLSVRNFKEFIQIHYKLDTTTAQGLTDLASKDPNVQRIFEWLTTWCGFSDWAHILRLLYVLKIKDSGAEIDIESRTNDLLSEVFVSDKIEQVRLKIKSYVVENTSFTGAIKPRALLFKLKEHLQPNVGSWTLYNKEGATWCISGINDIETNSDIERPSFVVPKVWGNNSLQNLKMNVEIGGTCKITDSLLRMMIHQSGNSNAHCKNSEAIKNTIQNSIGGTLGISESDVQNISIIENTEIFDSSDFRQLTNRSQSEVCSTELEEAMDIETWDRTCRLLDHKIDDMENLSSTTLRDKVEERWGVWKGQLTSDHDAIGSLFRSMVHPTAEGDNIKGKYRVGPKTAQHLTDSLYLLLIIAISLDPDNEGNWITISDKYNLVSIGLEYWSGDPRKPRRVRSIDEDGNLIIGRENANVLIFSKIKTSPNKIMEDLISTPSTQGINSIGDGKIPDLVITYNTRFRQLISSGDFNKVQSYITSELRNTDEITESNIREVIG
jgi:hypothetical protein